MCASAAASPPRDNPNARRSMKSTCLALVFVSGVAVAQPTDLVVQPGESIQPAINAAVDGDRILVEPGSYTGSVNFLGKRVELIGTGGSGATTLDASGLSNVPAVTATQGETYLTLMRGFTVVASSFTAGGCVRVAASELTLEDVVL